MLFGLYVTIQTCQVYFHHQVVPFLKVSQWTVDRQEEEAVYPELFCEPTDMTTSDLEDIVIYSSKQGVDTVLHHGLGYFPNLLPNTTLVSELRNYILLRNQRISVTENIPVIGYKNRWSLGLNVPEHDSISGMLQAIQDSSLLESVLNQVVGPNPALVELSSITAGPGADNQYFHQDTPSLSSATRYAASFSPLYSLLIPLQDTDPRMGPTAVCPGSHKCSYMPSCSKDGFQLYNKSTGYWRAGDGLLYNAQTQHRGGAHQGGLHRVALILTWAARPDFKTLGPDYSRSLPIGPVWAIRWSLWGHTFRTLSEMKRESWQTSLWDGEGWTFWRSLANRVVNNAFGYRKMDLEAMLRYTNLRYVPSSLQLEVEDDEQAFVSFAQDFLAKWSWFALYLNGVAVVVYVATQYQMIRSKEMRIQEGIQKALVLASGYLLLTSLGLAVFIFLSTTDWGIAVRQSMAHRPSLDYPEKAFSVEEVNSFQMPHSRDVLIGSRLTQATQLTDAQHRVFSFHPGNQRLWRALKERAALYAVDYRGLPPAFREALLLESLGNHDVFRETTFGDWILLSRQEALEMVSAWIVHSFSCDEYSFLACPRLRLCRCLHPSYLRLLADSPLIANKPVWKQQVAFQWRLQRTTMLRAPVSSVPAVVAEEGESQKKGDTIVEARERTSRKWRYAIVQSNGVVTLLNGKELQDPITRPMRSKDSSSASQRHRMQP
jgi:hypothetical protein